MTDSLNVPPGGDTRPAIVENDLLREFVESKVINLGDEFNKHWEETGLFDLSKVDKEARAKSKAALIYGQMTEPPGARLRVALTGLTVAEAFRDDEGTDVLLLDPASRAGSLDLGEINLQLPGHTARHR